MAGKRHLTKSRFKVGAECPTKLHFLDNKKFGSTKLDNSLLKALAEGGFQVGELAKVYHPGGTEISSLDKQEALKKTAELLSLDKATIFEAAFQHENLFIRVDILVKNGDHIQLIEVKAKSFDTRSEERFYTPASRKKGKPQIASGWHSYLLDVSFQRYVIQLCLPSSKVESFLMMADKSQEATVDGLNQRFFICEENGRTGAKIAAGTTLASVGKPLLCKVPVDEEIDLILASTFDNGLPFPEMVRWLSRLCETGEFERPEVGTQCKGCEFRIPEETKARGLASGFETCWKDVLNFSPVELRKPFVFDIWNFRKAGSLFATGKVFAEDLVEQDVMPSNAKSESEGLSNSERQWLQVEKIKAADASSFLDHEGLEKEMRAWRFPLNFIDFETTMAALPFHRGRRPYEQIAFQFSHHTIDSNGVIQHSNEFIHAKRGSFPNFEFVRALMNALKPNDGTIFRYAAHENTVLCQIRRQLIAETNPPADRDTLIAFIESITASESNPEDSWSGPRNMIDMCELVKRFYYHPATNGSNSIKKVLPALLSESSFLQGKYSAPCYGTSGGIFSKNFRDWTWMQRDSNGIIKDPYKLLPPIFTDIDLETMDSLITEGSIADGGAAMTAYARMQFTEMSSEEALRVVSALLKYCELDTFAMVLIYEHWKHAVESATRKAA